MKMNLQRLQIDLEMYKEHAQFEKDTEYQTAVEVIQEILNNYGAEEAEVILDRIAWMVRRETTKFVIEQHEWEDELW